MLNTLVFCSIIDQAHCGQYREINPSHVVISLRLIRHLLPDCYGRNHRWHYEETQFKDETLSGTNIVYRQHDRINKCWKLCIEKKENCGAFYFNGTTYRCYVILQGFSGPMVNVSTHNLVKYETKCRGKYEYAR